MKISIEWTVRTFVKNLDENPIESKSESTQRTLDAHHRLRLSFFIFFSGDFRLFGAARAAQFTWPESLKNWEAKSLLSLQFSYDNQNRIFGIM